MSSMHAPRFSRASSCDPYLNTGYVVCSESRFAYLTQYAAREAEIVAQAGRKHAITISTNMAGRGTDIILGGNPKVDLLFRRSYLE